MKAFTIMELLIAITLTAIISIAAFYAFELVQKQYLLYQNMTKEVRIYQDFVTIIQWDIAKANWIERQENDLVLHYPTYKLLYVFKDSSLWRINNLYPNEIDTLLIIAKWETTFFRKKRVEKGIVDVGRFELQAFGERQKLHFSKAYSARTLQQFTAKEH